MISPESFAISAAIASVVFALPVLAGFCWEMYKQRFKDTTNNE